MVRKNPLAQGEPHVYDYVCAGLYIQQIGWHRTPQPIDIIKQTPDSPMNHSNITLRFAALLACLGMPLVSRASAIIPSPAENRTEFHFEAGFTYASGVEKVTDQMKTNFGFERDYIVPVGLRLDAYAQTPSGFGYGGGVGPCEFFTVKDHNHHYSHNDDTNTSYIIPVFADLRYYFPKDGYFAPYVRAGVAYPIAGGDYIGSGTPGPVVAVGTKVWEHRIVAIGIEVGYDASKVEVKDGYLHQAEKVRPTEFTISVFASF